MADILKDLEQLEAKIREQEARASRSITVSVIVTVVVVIVMLTYFSIMAGMLREAAEPKGVASVISDQVRQQIPEVAKQLHDSAKETAPVIIDNIVDAGVKEMLPQVRKDVEKMIKDDIVKYFDQYQGYFLGQFDEIFEQHKDKINTLAQDLTTEEGTKKFEEDLYNTMVEALDDQEIALELESYAVTLADVDATLKFVTDETSQLNAEQESVKRLMALVRELTSRTEIGKGINLSE